MRVSPKRKSSPPSWWTELATRPKNWSAGSAIALVVSSTSCVAADTPSNANRIRPKSTSISTASLTTSNNDYPFAHPLRPKERRGERRGQQQNNSLTNNKTEHARRGAAPPDPVRSSSGCHRSLAAANMRHPHETGRGRVASRPPRRSVRRATPNLSPPWITLTKQRSQDGLKYRGPTANGCTG